MVLAARTLGVLLTVWALSDVSYLPGSIHSFIRYSGQVPGTSTGSDYLRHYYLINLSFLITRIVGYSLMARWLFRCGPDVEELLFPESLRDGHDLASESNPTQIR